MIATRKETKEQFNLHETGNDTFKQFRKKNTFKSDSNVSKNVLLQPLGDLYRPTSAISLGCVIQLLQALQQ